MEEKMNATPPAEPQQTSNENIINELKMMLQRAEEKAVERAKVADKVIREHPYQTIGIAFALGVLIGALVRRK
jgi:ElaB/YqjD/DUF883 family membrane-anchored ribosome-binding protein